ncbi:MAG TPA: diacylglycerol kinase [Planctomycetaceae bacterium]|nr:diacylglycerol kinase [Planctomycetaceae bacterium]
MSHRYWTPKKERGYQRKERTWSAKFRDAFAGLRQSLHQQTSFRAHFLAAILVLLTGWYLGRFDTLRWCLIVLCITIVIGGEMLNTSIETLARAVTSEYDPLVGRSLNIAGGAILVLSFGAAVVGSILFLEALAE